MMREAERGLLSPEEPAGEVDGWRAPWWLLPLLVTAALVGRGVFAACAGVYVDEAWTYFVACGSLGDAIASARPDLNPPTYSLLLHPLALLGRNPFLLRLPSVLCGVAVVPVAFAVGRRVHGETVAAWTAALVAVAYACILPDSQVRAYGALSLLSMAALWGRLEAERRGTPPGGWPLLATVCVLLSTVHYLGAMVVMGLLLGSWGSRQRGRLILALLPGLVACAGWACYSLAGPVHSVAGTRFLGAGSGLALQVFHTPGFLLGLLVPLQAPPIAASLGVPPVVMQGLVVALDLGAWLAFAAGLRSLARLDVGDCVVVALYVLVPLLGLTAGASLGLQPYQHRYAVVVAGAWYLVVAAGLLCCRGRWVLGLVVGVNLLIVALGFQQPFFWNQDWKSVVQFVEERRQPGDMLLVHVPYSLLGYNFYSQGGMVGVDISRPGAFAFQYPPPGPVVEQMGLVGASLGPDLERRLGRRRVFLVLNQEGPREGPAIRGWFGERYGMADMLEQRCLHTWGNTSTYLLVPRPAGDRPSP